MTTTWWMRSKCPNCGKEYKYEEVLSYILYGDFTDAYVQNIFDSYIKTCECGITFNMSEENHKNLEFSKDMSVIQPEPEEAIRKAFESMLKGYNKKDIL